VSPRGPRPKHQSQYMQIQACQHWAAQWGASGGAGTAGDPRNSLAAWHTVVNRCCWLLLLLMGCRVARTDTCLLLLKARGLRPVNAFCASMAAVV
jgi:hypothetical protein